MWVVEARHNSHLGLKWDPQRIACAMGIFHQLSETRRDKRSSRANDHTPRIVGLRCTPMKRRNPG